MVAQSNAVVVTVLRKDGGNFLFDYNFDYTKFSIILEAYITLSL